MPSVRQRAPSGAEAARRTSATRGTGGTGVGVVTGNGAWSGHVQCGSPRSFPVLTASSAEAAIDAARLP